MPADTAPRPSPTGPGSASMPGSPKVAVAARPSPRLVAGLAAFVAVFGIACTWWLGSAAGWATAPGTKPPAPPIAQRAAPGDPPVQATVARQVAATDPGAAIGGRVELSPALAAQVAPGDTVFVLARATQGPRMPLAVVRQQVRDLPFDFTLDDSNAMSPQWRLSQATRVVVVARISKTGQATRQPGDFEVTSAPTTPGTRGLKLVILR